MAAQCSIVIAATMTVRVVKLLHGFERSDTLRLYAEHFGIQREQFDCVLPLNLTLVSPHHLPIAPPPVALLRSLDDHEVFVGRT